MSSLLRRLGTSILVVGTLIGLSGCQLVGGGGGADASALGEQTFSLTAADDAWIHDEYDNGVEEQLWEVPKHNDLPETLCAIHDDVAVVGATAGGIETEVRLIDIRTDKTLKTIPNLDCSHMSGTVENKVYLFDRKANPAKFATLDLETGQLAEQEVKAVEGALNIVTPVGVKRGFTIVVLETQGFAKLVALQDGSVVWNEVVDRTPQCLMLSRFVACTTSTKAIAFDVETGATVIDERISGNATDMLWTSDGFYHYPDGPGARFDRKPVDTDGKVSRMAYPSDLDGATVPLAEMSQGYSNAYSFVLARDGRVVMFSDNGDWTVTETGKKVEDFLSSTGPVAATGSGKTFVMPRGAGVELWSPSAGALNEFKDINELSVDQLDGYLVFRDSAGHGPRVAVPKQK